MLGGKAGSAVGEKTAVYSSSPWRRLLLLEVAGGEAMTRSLVERICASSPRLARDARSSDTFLAALASSRPAAAQRLLEAAESHESGGASALIDEVAGALQNVHPSSANPLSSDAAFEQSTTGMTLQDKGRTVKTTSATKAYTCIPFKLHNRCSWELELTLDVLNNEKTVFGIAATKHKDAQLQDFDKPPAADAPLSHAWWVLRAFSGSTYESGVHTNADGSGARKVHPGDRIRFTIDRSERTLCASIVRKGEKAVMDLGVLCSALPAGEVDLFPVVIMYGQNRMVRLVDFDGDEAQGSLWRRLVLSNQCTQLVDAICKLSPTLADDAWSTDNLSAALQARDVIMANRLLAMGCPVDELALLEPTAVAAAAVAEAAEGDVVDCSDSTLQRLVLTDGGDAQALVEKLCSVSPALSRRTWSSQTLTAAIEAHEFSKAICLLTKGCVADDAALLRSTRADTGSLLLPKTVHSTWRELLVAAAKEGGEAEGDGRARKLVELLCTNSPENLAKDAHSPEVLLITLAKCEPAASLWLLDRGVNIDETVSSSLLAADAVSDSARSEGGVSLRSLVEKGGGTVEVRTCVIWRVIHVSCLTFHTPRSHALQVLQRLVKALPAIGPVALTEALAAKQPHVALMLLDKAGVRFTDSEVKLITTVGSTTGGGGNCWDTSDAGPWATIGGDDGCTITSKKSSPSGQNGLVRAKHGYSKGVHKWEIRVDSKDGGGDGYHAIGVATKNSTQTFKKWECGEGFYGIYLDGNFKISKAGKQSYGGLKWNVGTVWEVTLDMDKGELSFAYDGTSQGVAFTGLCGMELFPALAVGALNKNVYTARNMTLPATIMQQLLARDSCLTLVAKLVEMRPEMAAETFSAAALVDALKTGRFRCAAFLLERKAPIDPGLLLDGGADKCMWRTLVLNSSSACRSLVETICDASPALKAAADCSKTLMAAIVARSSATCMWLLDRGVKLDETELLESNSMAPSVEEKFAFTKSSIGGQVTLSDGGALAQSHAKKGYACVPIALHGQCSWEVTLVDDKEGDQTTCFGVSTQLTGDQLMSYDTCKSVHVVRSYNGAVSSGGSGKGSQETRKLHPGDRVVFTVDRDARTLAAAVYRKGASPSSPVSLGTLTSDLPTKEVRQQ